jgi:hypothetical protein
MVAIDYFSFEGNEDGGIAPHRPSVDDLGGESFENDTAYPPDDDAPCAEQQNEIDRVLAAVAGISPVLAFTLDFNSGDPYIARFYCANRTVSMSSLTLTDNGSGDTSVVYPEGKLPPAVLDPAAFNNAPTTVDSVGVTLNEATRTIRVVTNGGGSGVDGRVTVLVY